MLDIIDFEILYQEQFVPDCIYIYTVYNIKNIIHL